MEAATPVARLPTVDTRPGNICLLYIPAPLDAVHAIYRSKIVHDCGALQRSTNRTHRLQSVLVYKASCVLICRLLQSQPEGNIV